MNLLSVLKNIVILETEHKNYRPTVIFSKIVDNKLIQLISTKHQKIDRFGNHSYDDLVSIYQDYLDTRKSKYQNPPRIGVPDSMVKNFFENNVEKIYQTFETEKPENNQIIFVKKRKDNEDENFFDYTEILIKKDGNFFSIITSAFSKDGQYLKTENEEKKSKRVKLEFYYKSNLIVVYL